MAFDSFYIHETESHISEKALERFRNQQLPRDTIMYTALSYGFGKIGIAKQWLLTNQQINSIVANKDHDFRFVYYLLRVSTPYIFSFNSGIDTPIVPKSVFEKIKLRAPSLPVQRKIAAVLSAYDDLIENNRRRIALLEKAAEELYREWFVRLRFPGHEQTKIVKGVPEGWEVKRIGDLGDYLNGYPFGPDDWKNEGLPIIKIRELKQGIDENTPRNSGELVPHHLHVIDGDILFSWSGSLEIALWHGGPGLLNQHLFRVIPRKAIPKGFLFLALKSSIPQFAQLTTGATMQHIKRKELNHVKALIPGQELLDSFEGLIAPILETTMGIFRSISLLSTARDRLLSRLMAGKIDVEDLDIRFPASMREEAE